MSSPMSNDEVMFRRAQREGVLLALVAMLPAIPKRCDITIWGITDIAIRALDQEVSVTDDPMRRQGLRSAREIFKEARSQFR
ncbi:MAG: hypothetical protein F4059_09070 [Gemmatimonadetes bacterium]|nr:hypothetical protein [Gemmatimonadota bacterium]